MKKQVILFVMLVCAMHILMGVKARTATEEERFIGEATIIHAQFQDNQFILQLEMNNKVYTGRLSEELTYSDYLSLHHNVGMVIEISYTIDDNVLIIHSWRMLK